MSDIKLFEKLDKFNSDLADELLHGIEIKKTLKSMFAQQKDKVKLLNYLIAEKHYYEANYLLILGLPLREIVWWSYLAALTSEGKRGDEKILTALTAVRHWVYKQQDDLRYQAKLAAENLDLYSVSRWTALATFWSGDNISANNKTLINPSKLMPRMAAMNAITLSAINNDCTDINYLTIFMQGIHIANGGNGQLNKELQEKIINYLED